MAIGQDYMDYFFPIAWAAVDKETSRTWSWFLVLWKQSLDFKDGDGVTFISDMQKVSNFNFFFLSVFFCQVHFFHNCCLMNLHELIDAKNIVVLEARHRFCARHIGVKNKRVDKQRSLCGGVFGPHMKKTLRIN